MACVVTLVVLWFAFDGFETKEDKPLLDHYAYNIFDHIKPYVIEASNCACTKEIISTEMRTDDNKKNYKAIVKIPAEDPVLKEAWQDDNLVIALQTRLQKTTEWEVNNKYRVSIYYIDKDQEHVLFDKTYVGYDNIISEQIKLSKNLKEKDIYIKYESVLGKILWFNNGNDLRYQDNELYLD